MVHPRIAGRSIGSPHSGTWQERGGVSSQPAGIQPGRNSPPPILVRATRHSPGTACSWPVARPHAPGNGSARRGRYPPPLFANKPRESASKAGDATAAGFAFVITHVSEPTVVVATDEWRGPHRYATAGFTPAVAFAWSSTIATSGYHPELVVGGRHARICRWLRSAERNAVPLCCTTRLTTETGGEPDFPYHCLPRAIPTVPVSGSANGRRVMPKIFPLLLPATA